MSLRPTWTFPSCTSLGWTKSTESTCSTSRKRTAQARPSKSERVMRRMIGILAAAIVVTAVAIFAAQPRTGDTPVVVELFTSQGCSSCPSADELLRRIARDPKLRGRVVPLAYRVDYWNRLGWHDPFSSREWSQRQGEYVRTMKLESAYTPQVVINGTRQMVGSNSFAVYRAIEEESQRKTDA